ncbi:DUF6476 family protein [Oceaniglobus ichthyenteri]|uniref:DUF6476 family protein n=1 Tax=Oceaniglobus ichthyenteri TaxID=2136177 RepID=UPI00197D0D56|nr:DUF6476 family protein [Oceaniglobus ichthyenteri]
MDNTPLDPEQQRMLRFLRILVTALTATMLGGLIILIYLFVTRFPQPTPVLALPDSIALPGGTSATAFTRGPDWLAVVVGNEILIFDSTGQTLRQRIAIGE